MDGFQEVSGTQGVPTDVYWRRLAVVGMSEPLKVAVEGLTEHRFGDLDAFVVSKSSPGFSDACIDRLREIIRDAAAGRLGHLKFLVFDFAHSGEAGPRGDSAFQALVTEAANLILQVPIVLVANARGLMSGADLEFALACSMLIGEAGARFSFSADPIVSIGTYGFLAQKIGFVRAERLMESGDVLDAQQMHDLLLLKHVTESGAGLDGIASFLTRTAKRYNSCYGIYRAHRMATGAIRDGLRAYG
jgi:enoyl-CoA hydratase/carnithine racemase